MRERRREGGRGSEQNILCVFSAFIGGTLITVRVKLNMREISRAAGVGGEGGCGGGGGVVCVCGGGQSRGGRASEEPLSPNVLFPASYLRREDKELDK